MNVKEKLKNGKDRVVKFVDDHLETICFMWVGAVGIGSAYLGYKAGNNDSYRRGRSVGYQAGSINTVNVMSRMLENHMDVEHQDLENCFEEHGSEYGFVKR